MRASVLVGAAQTTPSSRHCHDADIVVLSVLVGLRLGGRGNLLLEDVGGAMNNTSPLYYPATQGKRACIF